MSKKIALVCATACLLSMSGSRAGAQGAGPDKEAYYAAIKCFIVAGNASAERKRAGDGERAVQYESKAHAAFDLAVKLGRAAGQNGSYIEADIAETQERELPKLVQDVNYNRRSAATCKALGLL